MINEAVEYIRQELALHMGVDPGDVTSGHIHGLKDDTNAVGAFVSVVNLHEETTLRNTEHYIRQNNQVLYKQPPIFLNLFLLFVFKFENYGASLLRLSQAVELFQHRRVFSASNQTPTNPFPPALEKLCFDFHNLNLEQLNHLWGILGGAYFPSLLYKVRLVRVQRDVTEEAPEITSIQLEASVS